MTFTHVLRRRDIVELFDTTPDLAGADIDVSRFIREADDHNVQVFWRDVDDQGPTDNEPTPTREELCSAPMVDISKGKRPMWRWDHLGKRWERPESVYPGMVLMLAASAGGYDPTIGWNDRYKKSVPVLETRSLANDHYDRDRWSENRTWVSIVSHTQAVVSEAQCLLAALNLDNESWTADLVLAAHWHDAGKAHQVFQRAMPDERPHGGPWAKSVGKMKTYHRRGFRHELASALAMLQNGQSNLAAYLVAAHHGRVRLSIRSFPNERHPEGDPEARFARGIWEGDPLPVTDLGDGVTMPKTAMTLSYMELGEDEKTGPSWLARVIALRDHLGPFQLAFLEALMRIADWRGSGDPLPDPGEEVKR